MPLDVPLPTSTSSSAASPSQAAVDSGGSEKKVGKSVEVHNVSNSGVITLLSVVTTSKSKEDGDPPKSGEFVVCEVEVAGTKGEYPVNPLYLKVKLPDGKEVDSHDGNAFDAPAEPELTSGRDLKAGEKLTAKIAFDAKVVPGTKLVITDSSDDVAGEIPLA
ncbi:hypothetical protein HUW46_04612 [Amycolatopsis sp. CA-230715]|nr:hypothetical protein HUW46_04612 [Amycolatopsis sp. CA-230715]